MIRNTNRTVIVYQEYLAVPFTVIYYANYRADTLLYRFIYCGSGDNVGASGSIYRAVVIKVFCYACILGYVIMVRCPFSVLIGTCSFIFEFGALLM